MAFLLAKQESSPSPETQAQVLTTCTCVLERYLVPLCAVTLVPTVLFVNFEPCRKITKHFNSV